MEAHRIDHGRARPLDESSAKDTPKSLRTRARILEAATTLFAQIGYAAAHNARIAEAAGLTRGAMLYHFATREALVSAAVEHIQTRRRALFEAADKAAPAGADMTDHAIDAYWAMLRDPAFIAFYELEAAARTDPMVRERIAPAQAEFDSGQISGRLLTVQVGAGPRLQAGQDLARFVLEGLARAALTHDAEGRTERLLAVVKRITHALNRKGAASDLWPD